MTKKEFIHELRNRLKGLPNNDIEDCISFYSEMIDDRIADGENEEQAVAAIDIDDAVKEAAAKTPLLSLVKHNVKPKRSLRAWEIILLILGFPLWFPLALVFLVLVFVLVLLIWILVIVTYSVEVALLGGAVVSFASFIGYFGAGQFNLMPLGASIMAAGLALLFLILCVLATKLTAKLSKKIVVGIKMIFIGRGDK